MRRVSVRHSSRKVVLADSILAVAASLNMTLALGDATHACWTQKCSWSSLEVVYRIWNVICREPTKQSMVSRRRHDTSGWHGLSRPRRLAKEFGRGRVFRVTPRRKVGVNGAGRRGGYVVGPISAWRRVTTSACVNGRQAAAHSVVEKLYRKDFVSTLTGVEIERPRKKLPVPCCTEGGKKECQR